jgi:hypothetical protein
LIVRNKDLCYSPPRKCDAVRQFGRRRRESRDKLLGIVIKRDSAFHYLDALLRSEIISNEHAVREPVRELRSEVSFVRVHRPNQDISTFDRPRDPIALHAVSAGGCGIEDVIGEMVR